MPRISQLSTEFVDFIPESLESGMIYISRRYSTAAHLCCCGCGLEVVTPLNPAKWRLTETEGIVSLYPSIGNWSFPCQSHYWIEGNCVVWAEAMTPETISAVRARDRRDSEVLASKPRGVFAQFRQWLVSAFSKLWGLFQK
jgi:hypothetical protein